MSGGYQREYSNVYLENLGNVEARNINDGDHLAYSTSTKKWTTQAANNSWKSPVRVATTGALPFPPGSFVGLLTIDGVFLQTGDRVLCKNEAGGLLNGIWVASDISPWVRASDMLDGSNAAGSATFVNEGTTNADTIWTCTSNTAVVGTDPLSFNTITVPSTAAGADTQVQFNSSGALAADSTFTFDSVANILTSPQISDGIGLMTGGNLSGMSTGFFSGQVTAGTFTDGTTVMNAGTISGSSSISATTLTDGTASLSGGSLTGGINLNAQGQVNLASIGTMGVFGATPVPQQVPAGVVAGHTSGAGAALNVGDTFTGGIGASAYTLGDVVSALKNLGFLAN